MNLRGISRFFRRSHPLTATEVAAGLSQQDQFVTLREVDPVEGLILEYVPSGQRIIFDAGQWHLMYSVEIPGTGFWDGRNQEWSCEYDTRWHSEPFVERMSLRKWIKVGQFMVIGENNEQ